MDAVTSPVASNVRSIQNQIPVEKVDASTSPFVSMIRRQYSKATSPFIGSVTKSPYISLIRIQSPQTTNVVIGSTPSSKISRSSTSSTRNETPSLTMQRIDYISPANAQSLKTVSSFFKRMI